MNPSVRDAVAGNADRYVAWLGEACAIPSLAGQPDGLQAMADWVEGKLRSVGASCRRLVYGDAPEAVLGHLGSGARSVLVYDHYDVQPVDPIELWDSKPFDPEVRNGVLYARGAADNKGDLVARLAALDVHRELFGEPPIEVKFLVEGEEETGSKSFEELVSRHGDELAADGCIWEGNGIDPEGRAQIVFGAKGLAYVELTLVGLAEDQHSSLAVVVPSPAWRLVEALTTLRAPDGRVLIDGFYDDVVGPSEDDEAMLSRVDFDEAAERTRLGIDAFVGAATGVELLRKMFFEPTCNIAGFVSGFTVPDASKTVLPKEAMAKLDMRLVPDQDPADIVAKLRTHLDRRGFDDIEMKQFSMEHPVRSPSNSAIATAAVRAAEEVFPGPPNLSPMMIGTGPMYPVAATLGIPTVSPGGVCRPDSNIHAPNENVRIEDFLRVVEYTVAWIREFAA